MARFLSHRCACTRGVVATYRVEDAARGVRMVSNRPPEFKPTTRAFRPSRYSSSRDARTHASSPPPRARKYVSSPPRIAHAIDARGTAVNARRRAISHPRAIDANVFGTHERVTRARDGGD
jgi:hypothetical protein